MNSVLKFTIPYLGEVTLWPKLHEPIQEDGPWLNRGFIYQLKGELKPAMEAYRRGLVKEPSNFKIINNLAACYLVQGDIKNARSCLKKIKAVSEPRNFNQVLCLLTSFQYNEGVETIENIFKDKEEYYLLRGILLFNSSKYTEAIKDILEYCTLTHQTKHKDQLLTVINQLDRNLDKYDRRINEIVINRSVTPSKSRKVKIYISRISQKTSIRPSGSLQVLRTMKWPNDKSFNV